MYLADCHNHTCCSHDSEAPLSLMLEQAARMGLSMVCTTDHMDLMDRQGTILPDWDWVPILEQHEQALSACPPGVELRLGTELNMPHLLPERHLRLLARAPLDMVVGSAHNMSAELGGLDFLLWDYTDEGLCYKAMDDYFVSLLALSKTDFIDILAHIPYVFRYMNDRDGNRVTLERYRDRLDTVLNNLIHRGAGIEVNTNRGKSLADYRPLLEQYHQLGGEIITIGTDAHTPADLGKGVEEAARLLKEIGFRYYTVYRRRKPEFIPL